MNRPMYWAVLISLGGLLGCARSTEHLTPVQPFELNRYLGTWYEIARFDHSFERGLSNVTATYTPKGEMIQVLNRGYDDESGEWQEAEGKAKFAGEKTVGHLRVSFFGPFYGDYKILMLDRDYKWSAITSSSYKYLWILAREPALPGEIRDEIIAQLKSYKFDVNGLIWVTHGKRGDNI